MSYILYFYPFRALIQSSTKSTSQFMTIRPRTVIAAQLMLFRSLLSVYHVLFLTSLSSYALRWSSGAQFTPIIETAAAAPIQRYSRTSIEHQIAHDTQISKIAYGALPKSQCVIGAEHCHIVSVNHQIRLEWRQLYDFCKSLYITLESIISDILTAQAQQNLVYMHRRMDAAVDILNVQERNTVRDVELSEI